MQQLETRNLSHKKKKKKKKNYLGTVSLDKIRLLKVVMSLTVREVLYRDKRLLAEKIGPPTCQIIRNSAEGIVLSVYKACRHIFCIVSHFFLVVHACYINPKSYAQITTMRRSQQLIGM